MKYKIFIPILFIIIITMFSNSVFADDENIDIVNIPGQTSLPVTAIPSDNIEIVNIPGQTSVPVLEIPSDNVDIVNIEGQKSEPVTAIPSEESDEYEASREDTTKHVKSNESSKNTNVTNSTSNKEEINIKQDKTEEIKENIINDEKQLKYKNNEVVQSAEDKKGNSGIEHEPKNEFNAIWIILGIVCSVAVLGTIVVIIKRKFVKLN